MEKMNEEVKEQFSTEPLKKMSANWAQMRPGTGPWLYGWMTEAPRVMGQMEESSWGRDELLFL